MESEGGARGAVTSVARGLALLSEGMEELLCASAAPLDTRELLGVLRGVEVATRKAAAVGHQVLTQCQEQGTAITLGHRRLPELLHEVLRISKVDARARIRAAEVCGPRRALTGEPLEPVHPHTAAAAYIGTIGAEHTRIIGQVLGRIPAALGPVAVAQAEEALAGYAMTMAPEQLTAVGHRLLAHLNPDGRLTDERDRARRRSLGLGRQGMDLMSSVSGTLTPACRAKLDAVFAKLACPGAATDTGAGNLETEPSDEAAAADPRTQAQRNHDALEALCDLVLGSPRLGTHRGLPVTAMITMTLTDLERATGLATTASGGTLPLRDALAMAERAHPVLVLFDHDGRPLHLGRERRLASADQRLALIAAERGCTKPSCLAPADQCQTHHLEEWEQGGRTDITNLSLACVGHHAQVNRGPNGWTTTMGGDPHYPGRSAWTPPHHLDPTGTPRVNRVHHPEQRVHEVRGACGGARPP